MQYLSREHRLFGDRLQLHCLRVWILSIIGYERVCLCGGSSWLLLHQRDGRSLSCWILSAYCRHLGCVHRVSPGSVPAQHRGFHLHQLSSWMGCPHR